MESALNRLTSRRQFAQIEQLIFLVALPAWPPNPRPMAGTAMKLAAPLAARSAARAPGLRLALEMEIERHCSADQILQGRLIDLVAFVEVDGAPDIPVEAGVE